MFVSYLWGIETRLRSEDGPRQIRVCILPMRDWNFTLGGLGAAAFGVCILPMRDWNTIWWQTIWPRSMRLYLTYEGLKRADRLKRYKTALEFVSYLWGIETALACLYEAFELGFVSYLWGIETAKSLPSIIGRRLFVSYLWGIETIPGFKITPDMRGLYLTYEGLKLGSVHARYWRYARFVSYLWGIETFRCKVVWWRRVSGLYLTYEGLKPTTAAALSRSSVVCILPMRDWNKWNTHIESPCPSFVSYLWGIETGHFSSQLRKNMKVCILPMRDWNKNTGQIILLKLRSLYLTYEGLKQECWAKHNSRADSFVSYLWGIETADPRNHEWYHPSFVSYLWGIETIQIKNGSTTQALFVSYLWGIETRFV